MLVVIDTNVLVSALWSPDSNPAKILNMVLTGALTPCCDWRIRSEYEEVLRRPRFQFSVSEVDALLDLIDKRALSVLTYPCDEVFIDTDDKMFYEVAAHCDAILITGNAKHFPQEPHIVSPAQFLARLA